MLTDPAAGNADGARRHAPAGAAVDLVLDVGKSKFLASFAAYLRADAGVDEYIVCAWPGQPHATPRVLASSSSELPVLYCGLFCDKDPNRGVLMRGRAEGRRFVFPPLGDRRYGEGYRELLESRGYIDQLQMACWSGEVCYSVGYYRKDGQAPFATEDARRFSDAAPLVLNLIVRHFESQAGGVTLTEQELERVVRELSPASPLTRREVQVCTLILLGCSSEAIALRLGIASHSVQTYRRRAYKRLSIAAQNELFAKVLKRFGALYGSRKDHPPAPND